MSWPLACFALVAGVLGVGWLAYNLASRLSDAGGYAGLDIGDAVISWLNELQRLRTS